MLSTDRGLAGERLADRLRDVRAATFVGREREIALFRSALVDTAATARDRSFAVLYMWGPGGVGKSALLRRFADEARTAGQKVVWVDARAIERSPTGFAQAARGAGEPGTVLLIDTFESAQGMEGWFWDAFLPQLPGDALVVVASRHQADPGRHLDPDWSATVREIPIEELPHDEAVALLRVRGVSDALGDALYAFTGGHPLALILAAEVAARDAGEVGRWQLHEPAIKTLLDRLVGELPSPAHRRALEICAHVFVTREALLTQVLGEQGPQLFAWLREQPFIEAGPHGLQPHDLLRDLLIADLRWRDPDGWRSMHKQVRTYFIERALTAVGPEVLPSQMALNYLHRHGDLMGKFITWRGQGEVYEDVYRPADSDAVLAMTEQLNGRSGAALTEFWLRRQPEAFRVYRRPGVDEPVAFVTWLELHEPDEEENRADPLVAALWAHARRTTPARPGTKISVQRFINVGGSPPTPSPTTDLIYMRGVATCMLGRDLAWTYILMPNADRWAPILEYVGHERLTGPLHSVFAHDWTAVPKRAWLDQMQERLLRGLEQAAPRARSVQPSRATFQRAVRDLLRNWRHRPSVAANPLIDSSLAGHGDLANRIENLRAVVEEAVDSLQGTPRGDMLHRTLAASFFHGTPTQEEAAERLHVPFGTYRHRLAAAIDQVAEELWRRAPGADR
jgi:hypothetical protein